MTPLHRLRLARLIIDHGWPVARAAERHDVGWPTAKRWAIRYLQLRAELGAEPSAAAVLAGMGDRSSRPRHSPHRTRPVVRKIVHLRWKQRLGPVASADQVRLASSTVHAVLVRGRLNRLSHLGRATGQDDGLSNALSGTAPRGRRSRSCPHIAATSAGSSERKVESGPKWDTPS